MPMKAVRRSRTARPKASKAKLKVDEVWSWSEYLELIREDYLNWAFRGHAGADWKLVPTITRELENRHVNPKYWLEQEHRILWVFQRKVIHYLSNPPHIGDTFRWLALMQHSGAPTRLLDFTWSAYVAAFFALESATGDAAVWALNTPALGTFAFGPAVADVDWPPSPDEAMKPYLKDDARVVIGEPYFKPQRLIAQSGTFICPTDIHQPLENHLAARPGLVTKIVFRGPEVRKEALAELYRMNISQATLFPDLDGLARSLRYELETHYAYDPTL
jgi:hypothetical protein